MKAQTFKSMRAMKHRAFTRKLPSPTVSPARRHYFKLIDTTTFVLLLVSFVVYLATVFRYTTRRATETMLSKNESLIVTDKLNAGGTEHIKLPELVILRQTIDTTDMSDKIINALLDIGYHAFDKDVQTGLEIEVLTRNEFIRPNPRRILITDKISHSVSKSFHPRQNAVTLAFISHEDNANLNCSLSLASAWLGHKKENNDIYIDLPLSPKHPALSTSALRAVFPSIRNLNLTEEQVHCMHGNDTEKRNDDRVKDWYTETKIRSILMERLLVATGFPFVANHSSALQQINLPEMVDAAEKIERVNIGWTGVSSGVNGGGNEQGEKRRSSRVIVLPKKQWSMDKDGNVIVEYVQGK